MIVTNQILKFKILVLLFTIWFKPIAEKIKINGNIYSENLPSQSAQLNPIDKVKKNIKKYIIIIPILLNLKNIFNIPNIAVGQ